MTTDDRLDAIAADLTALRRDVERQFAIVDAKLDAKPNLVALYQAVVTLMFGIGAVITSTVVVLKSTGVIP
jgi:hypothetical protein